MKAWQLKDNRIDWGGIQQSTRAGSGKGTVWGGEGGGVGETTWREIDGAMAAPTAMTATMMAKATTSMW